VFEFLEGETLAARLEKGPLPVEQALKIGREICDALDRAHRHGITHRDLKPGNVMLTRSGAKLLDFGLAKPSGAVSADAPLPPRGADASLPTAMMANAPITTRGTILGTFQYMSPEQIEGQDADARSDIWSLGCLLYEALTGKHAFEGKTQASLVSAIIKDQPPSISGIQPLAPPGLDRIVATCLAKDPDARWQSAADLARELQWVMEARSGVSHPRRPRAAPPHTESCPLAPRTRSCRAFCQTSRCHPTAAMLRTAATKA
jgi:serine/threonine protein kinase